MSDPRRAWQHVLDQNPELPWAAPVLVDESGRQLLPTGEITVRFVRPLTRADLEEFSQRYGLTVRSRNDLIPAQVVFLPANRRETYLPELADRLSEAPGVVVAFASTRSGYNRV